ncbi:MAG: CRISPR-associated endoribonuclease Cas6 [Petrotogales bacterium]
MRLRVGLSSTNENSISLNHSYHIASLIYRSIERSNPNLSLDLHTPSTFKLFTFGKLLVEDRKFSIKGDKMVLKTPNVYFFFSTMVKDIGVSLVEGLLEKPEVKIGGGEFVVSEVKVMEEEEISDKQRFVTLSPVNVTTVEGNGDGRRIVDLYPKDSRFYDNLRQNLVKKYRMYYGEEPEDDGLSFKVVKSKAKRIQVKDTFHRCVEMVFDAEGSKELLDVGYKAGFGERNSMGFGMVKAV